MTTAAQRLVALSGLSGASAGDHLKRIAGAAGIAGALLVTYSGLPTGTAAQHLLTDNQAVVQPSAPSTAQGLSGGGGSWTAPKPRYVAPAHTDSRQKIEVPIPAHDESDEEEIVMAVLMRIAQMEYYA